MFSLGLHFLIRLWKGCSQVVGIFWRLLLGCELFVINESCFNFHLPSTNSPQSTKIYSPPLFYLTYPPA